MLLITGPRSDFGNKLLTTPRFATPVALLPVPVPMIEVRAAAKADWKLGSAVIALVAAAMVSADRDC